SAINQRRVQADEARRQAEEVAAEAHGRGADAENGRGRATEAGEEAGKKAGRAEQALADAEVAFVFQAEDGIRDWSVTGVQTCALPISISRAAPAPPAPCKWSATRGSSS